MILLEGRTNGMGWRVQAEEGRDEVRVTIEAARPVTAKLDAIGTAEALARWAQRCARAWQNEFGPPEIGSVVVEGDGRPRAASVEVVKAP